MSKLKYFENKSLTNNINEFTHNVKKMLKYLSKNEMKLKVKNEFFDLVDCVFNYLVINKHFVHTNENLKEVIMSKLNSALLIDNVDENFKKNVCYYLKELTEMNKKYFQINCEQG